MTDPETSPETSNKRTVPVRAMELIVAALFMGIAAIVIHDSLRLGAGWGDFGPQSGFFPFYIGLFMLLASAINFIVNLIPSEQGSKTFVERSKFKQILRLLIPTAIFVALIAWLGLYLAAAIYVAGFMWAVGSYGPLKSLTAGVGVALLLFWLFEKAFLIPLPKGPLEAALGV